MRLRLPRRRPSLPTAISLLALAVAMTGTAAAATGTVVNIADGVNAARLAVVDGSGALRTVQSNIPVAAKPLNTSVFLFSGANNIVIGPSSGQLAISRIGISNYFRQVNAMAARFDVYQQGSNGTTCTGSSVRIGSYDVQAGQTVLDAVPSPIVLKPMSGHPSWCVTATMEVADTASYYAGTLVLSGYVTAGTVSGAASTVAGEQSNEAGQPTTPPFVDS